MSVDFYFIGKKPHPGHDEHLCAIVAEGAKIEEYMSLIKDGKFVCKTCGRTAAKKENLCEPTPIH